MSAEPQNEQIEKKIDPIHGLDYLIKQLQLLEEHYNGLNADLITTNQCEDYISLLNELSATAVSLLALIEQKAESADEYLSEIQNKNKIDLVEIVHKLSTDIISIDIKEVDPKTIAPQIVKLNIAVSELANQFNSSISKDEQQLEDLEVPKRVKSYIVTYTDDCASDYLPCFDPISNRALPDVYITPGTRIKVHGESNDSYLCEIEGESGFAEDAKKAKSLVWIPCDDVHEWLEAYNQYKPEHQLDAAKAILAQSDPDKTELEFTIELILDDKDTDEKAKITELSRYLSNNNIDEYELLYLVSELKEFSVWSTWASKEIFSRLPENTPHRNSWIAPDEMPDRLAISFLAIEATSIRNDREVYDQALAIILSAIPTEKISDLPEECFRDVIFALVMAHRYSQEQ